MKRTLKYALSAVLGAALVIPALAQDQFPDVPANHWAYKDLQEMKANGLLVGYPDGLFRGGRPASRYELAVAVHATWANLKAQQDAMKSQIDDILKRLDNTASKSDLDALRSQLEALQTEVNRIKSEDIARLNRLVDEFRAELTKLGADVNQMKSDIAALGNRVTNIEKRLPNFDVSGDLNALALGGYGQSGRNGVTVDDRPTGVGRGPGYTNAPIGVNKDLTFLHEGAFTITSHNDNPNAVKFKATGVFGNMLGGNLSSATGTGFTDPRIPDGGTSFPGAFGSQSFVYPGSAFQEGSESFYFQDFYVQFNTSLAGLKFNAQVGRVGYQVSPYMFKRPDTSPYFANDRWDNGDWNFDGGILGFNFGRAKLDVFGGRTSSFVDSNGNLVQPMYTGRSGFVYIPGEDRPRGYYSGGFGFGGPGGTPFTDGSLMFQVDQMLGGKLGLPLGSTGALNLAYIWLDSNAVVDTGTSGAPSLTNGTAVYGGDAKFNFSGIGVDGSYQKSDTRYNGRSVNTRDDSAWNANVSYNRDKFGISGGYRRIDPFYSAPGDWGRIGIWWNPTDIKGWKANAYYDLTKSLRLTAAGKWYTGTDTTRGGVMGLSNDDRINRYVAGLEYKLGASYNLALGYEEVDWRLVNRADTGFIGGKPRERWYNVGFGFDLGNRAKLSVLWQISDYDGKGIVGFNPFGAGTNGVNSGTAGSTRATGGLITTQLTIKY